MDSLPTEILDQILKTPPRSDYVALRSVCTRWRLIVTPALFSRITITCCADRDDVLRLLGHYSLEPVSKHTRHVRLQSCSSPPFGPPCRYRARGSRLVRSLPNPSRLRELLDGLRGFGFSNGDDPMRLAPIPAQLDCLFACLRAGLRSLTVKGSFFVSVFRQVTYRGTRGAAPYFPCLEVLRIRRVEDGEPHSADNYIHTICFVNAHLGRLQMWQVWADYYSMRDWDRMYGNKSTYAVGIDAQEHPGVEIRDETMVHRKAKLHDLHGIGTVSLIKGEIKRQHEHGFGWVWIRRGYQGRYRDGDAFLN